MRELHNSNDRFRPAVGVSQSVVYDIHDMPSELLILWLI